MFHFNLGVEIRPQQRRWCVGGALGRRRRRAPNQLYDVYSRTQQVGMLSVGGSWCSASTDAPSERPRQSRVVYYHHIRAWPSNRLSWRERYIHLYSVQSTLLYNTKGKRRWWFFAIWKQNNKISATHYYTKQIAKPSLFSSIVCFWCCKIQCKLL